MSKIDVFYQNIGIIALRKVELYNRIIYQIDKKRLKSINKEALNNKIMDIISNMDNTLFISEKEKVRKIIIPNSKLDELNLNGNKIIKIIYEELEKI